MFRKVRNFFLLLKIRFKYRKDFIILNSCVNLSEDFIKSKKILWDEKNSYSKVVIYLLPRSIQRVRAIKILCERGMGQDAGILVRALFEDFVDFGYILNDKTRADNFLNYGLRTTIQIGEILLKSADLKLDKVKIQKKLEVDKKKWDSIKFNFPNPTRRWNGKSLEETCNELGLTGVYDIAYRFLSQFAHPSAMVMSRYVLGWDEDGIVVEVGASEALLKECMKSAIAIQLDMLAALNKDFSLGFDNKINRLTVNFKK